MAVLLMHRYVDYRVTSFGIVFTFVAGAGGARLDDTAAETATAADRCFRCTCWCAHLISEMRVKSAQPASLARSRVNPFL